MKRDWFWTIFFFLFFTIFLLPLSILETLGRFREYDEPLTTLDED